MISLGLDISTKTIGLSVITTQNHLITHFHTEHFNLPITPNRLLKLIAAKEYIQTKLAEFNPDSVAIEDFAQFMGGKSNAKTIISLAIMNATIALTVLELTQTAPHMLNVNTVRAKLKAPGRPRIAKEALPETIAALTNIPWLFLRDKKGKLTPQNYDRAVGEL